MQHQFHIKHVTIHHMDKQLRKAISSLQASFWNDAWKDKFESVNAETHVKYEALQGAMSKILVFEGTQEDFVILRDACASTEWLVAFLETWKASEAQNRHFQSSENPYVTFIQRVIDNLGKIYPVVSELINNAHRRTPPPHAERVGRDTPEPDRGPNVRFMLARLRDFIE